ncbi:hypothetical protein A5651_03350 [Mycobacterium sp. 1274761.0]|nr:hypothetical protein A5651_03350 [Mycobacterium sp. 1274761.0]
MIIFLGALALGRLSIRSARDIRYAQRSTIAPSEPAAEPVASDDVTEIQPTNEVHERRHRPWDAMFGRRDRLAHR